MKRERARLIMGWIELLSRYRWDWFLNLTFRREVHPEAADKLFRVFVSKINRQLFGVRWAKRGKGIRWARALEFQQRGAIHYHALFGSAGLSELRRLAWMDIWFELAGIARIETPRDTAAVHSYVAKYVAKGGEIEIGGPLDADPPPSLFKSSEA